MEKSPCKILNSLEKEINDDLSLTTLNCSKVLLMDINKEIKK